MHIWGHFKTITKHKLMVMKYCFKIGLYRQGMLMICQSIHGQNFQQDVNIIRETAVQTMRREKQQGFQQRGFITMEEINIILNIG